MPGMLYLPTYLSTPHSNRTLRAHFMLNITPAKHMSMIVVVDGTEYTVDAEYSYSLALAIIESLQPKMGYPHTAYQPYSLVEYTVEDHATAIRIYAD